jgi:hypothetical protein
MPASAYHLAMNCLAMSCLATGAEALRRLCGGVPIAGRPMLGGPLVPDSVHRRPLSGACRPGPVPRGMSHRRLSPARRLEERRGQGAPRRLSRAPVSLSPPRLDGEFRRQDDKPGRRDNAPGCLRCTKRTSTTSPSSCTLLRILLLHFFSFRTPADGERIHGGWRAFFSTGPGGRTAAADVRQGAPRTARPGAVAAACEAVSGTCERQSSPAS